MINFLNERIFHLVDSVEIWFCLTDQEHSHIFCFFFSFFLTVLCIHLSSQFGYLPSLDPPVAAFLNYNLCIISFPYQWMQ